ncbi:TonB-dependent receptor [Solimonas flava]|uniref:TonB-dependent receptor n=1 Tax=Solimonas flava TaxID=415849 RepID=UPI000403AB13|nr:TonB-dependent receptor [Solimonas flava]
MSKHSRWLTVLLALPTSVALAQGAGTTSEADAAEVADARAAEAPELLATIPLPDHPGPPPAPEPPAANAALEEVIVTAQRRTASVQETPISMEAFNADKLAQRGIQGVQDLAANVPSMVIEPHPLSSSTLRITIRGVGITDSQVTQDPAVGIYLDGVYLARSAGLALELADLERVEVLRGPQGTLYGRNTTGGAVNLVTRRPSFDGFSMQQQLTYGSRNLLRAKSSLNIPLSDSLAVKIAALGSRSDGFVDNTGPGGDFGDRREWAARLDARWLAADWLTADYAYDRTDLEYWNAMFQAVIPSNTPHGMADYFKPYAQSQTVYSSRRLDHLATGAPLEASHSKTQGHALVLTSPLAEQLDLKYIGAYRELTDDQYPDLGGGAGSTGYRVDTNAYDGPAGIIAGGGEPTPLVIPRTYQHQWSHELQLSGKLFSDVDFIVGAYYFTEQGGEHGGPTHHIFNTKLDPSQLNAILDLAPSLRELLRDAALPGLAAFWDYDYAIDNSATALFGQFTWAPEWFDQRLRLTLGLRQSWDERWARKDFVQTQYIEAQLLGIGLTAVPVPAFVLGGTDTFDNVQASRKDSNFSPSFNLQYDLERNATVYASYATAYKSGGFNTRDPQISAASGAASDGTNYGFGFVEGFKPEEVRSIELGLKSEWLQRRLRLNTALFDSHYRDMQTNFMIPGTISDTKARNAGRARMRGVELDSAVVPLPGLIVSLQYAYLDAKVQEVIDINGNNVAKLYPFIAAPRHSGVGTIDWTFLQRGWGNLRAYVNYQYTGDRQGFVITEDKRGLTAINGYGVWNARLTAADLRLGADNALDVSLWGRNLADKEYPLTAVDNLPHADRAVVWGDPRAFGIDLVYRYR